MKKLITTTLILFTNLYISAQELTTKDSISIFYDSLIYQLKTSYLHSETTDWQVVLPIKEEAMESNSFATSLALCTALFDTINGSHLNIFSDYGWYKWSKGRQYVQEDFHVDFVNKLETQPGFEVSVIDDRYGYILMPSMLMLDLSQDSLSQETQRMYDEIVAIAGSRVLEGWIIDLRFNGGGNSFPMLTALYHFLGDNTLYTSLDQNDAVTDLVKLDEGSIYDDGEKMVSIIPSIQPDLDIPIALITGIITASSGELIPVSFSGRSNVSVIGEVTAGMLSGNSLTELPFDIKITLTSSYLADRKANYEPRITPEIEIVKQAHFDDLSKDLNIMEAIKFFETTNRDEK